jgi:molybdopterin converting factor small subunit
MPKVELYGSAQLLAGRRSLDVAGETLGEMLGNLAAQVPALVGTVLEADGRLTPAYTVNLNGLRFVRQMCEPVSATDEVLILSSLSGG